jgi:DNA invertase Pin-like site-specific DNA recombinase
MKAIGSARISKESERGVSLKAQAAKIRTMAEVQGAELLDVIVEDGESAKNLDRPGMRRLLELVDSRVVGCVIIAKLDRIIRSVKDLAELLERFCHSDVALVSVNESLDTATASGRLVMNLLCSVSQWERETIGERTRQALQFKKSIGQRIGGIPYGFQLAPDGKHLEPTAAEQSVLTRIRLLRSQGYTLRDIVDNLNRNGCTTRKGSAWHHVYIGEMLKRRHDRHFQSGSTCDLRNGHMPCGSGVHRKYHSDSRRSGSKARTPSCRYCIVPAPRRTL